MTCSEVFDTAKEPNADGKVKNILFILGMYHPQYSANGLCVKNVVEECLKRGHKVTVICNDYRGENKEDYIDGAHIYRIRHRLFDRVNQWCDKKETALRKTVRKINRLGNKLKLLVTAPVWPRIAPLYTHRFYKKAKKLYEKENFDSVISVYTPVSSLMAGYYLKKKHPEVEYIPYFLDSLSAGYAPKVFSKTHIEKRCLKLERKIFSRADKIVIMESSRKHHLKVNGDFQNKIKVSDIPVLKKPRENGEKTEREEIKILYTGSIDPDVRNPKVIIDALSVEKLENVTCEFVGNINCKNMFSSVAEKYGEALTFTHQVTHGEIGKKYRDADILLNIGNNFSTMVPSKIFEYMSYGKPIISTYTIPDEPSKVYLEKYPLALLISGDDSPEDNAEKIKTFINVNKDKRVEFEDIVHSFYHNTPQAFADIIENTEE